ncbi:hypothetical protein [Paenibacillus lautus]|uniref:hypothetical protein n=1 Tax=Paenibacillus lautus TaxID=1401 RepID=UPI002DB846D9|nr:hypothetical protein [Paenibacillus lautus]MEC0253631.1 hypothetical protein [Paenibacillus lautus]
MDKVPYIATYMVDLNEIFLSEDSDFQIQTATVEKSEPDEYHLKRDGEIQTFEIETSEPDELIFSDVTESVEGSEPDECILKSEVIETRSIERSDPDEIFCSTFSYLI